MSSSSGCVHCGSDRVQLKYVTRSYGNGAALLVIENIPLWSCPSCGECYFTAQTMHEIERIKVLRKSVAKARSVQDAKARFSEFLDACISDGPQLVTKRGAEAAVLVPVDEWRRLQAAARPSLKQLLISDVGRGDLLIARRGAARRRKLSAAG